MDKLDIYYRAFKAYRKETAESTLCERDRRSLAQSNPELDKLHATKYLCHIEEDWVSAIEEGLVYVEKAVQEDRQFIRTQGEVIPIEKVKKVSKDSVEHLARHSDMITHVPEEEQTDLVPDKLYMVEKLSDYAVYENRFLYMMLCYLRDFINYRLEKIIELRSTYVGDAYISKEVVTKKRKLVIESKVYEERTDNPYPIADESSADLLRRIQDCMHIVTALLGTELMTQVAKSPMIKPPVIKTNVLKMNNNFKRALALYDYIAGYKGEGYTAEEVNFDFAPFSQRAADEIAEAANLISFVTYKIGNEIDGALERAYLEEEQRRKEEEAAKLVERINRMKKRALESNQTLEEYMLLLETRIRMLEKDSEQLAVIRQEVEALNRRIEDLDREKAELNRRLEEAYETIEERDKEIIRLNQKYVEDMLELKKQHEQHIEELTAKHGEEILALKAAFADLLQETTDRYEQEIGQRNREIEDLRQKCVQLEEETAQKREELEIKLQEVESSRKQLTDEFGKKSQELERSYRKEFDLQSETHRKAIDELREEKALISGQLHGIRAKQGLMKASAEYTTRERFLELEAEFAAFQKFFKEQWSLTKKQIRKDVLWTKPEKPVKKKRGAKAAEPQQTAEAPLPPQRSGTDDTAADAEHTASK